MLKYIQLEKIQEQYVPSYEEQLKDTHEHLQRIQAALKEEDYRRMSPEFLLQMNFQLQTRLDKIRQQVPLHTPQVGVPLEALPPIGCVTKDDHFPREGDSSDPDPNVEGEPSTPVAAPRKSAADHAGNAPSTDHGRRTANGNAHSNGSLPELRDSVVEIKNQNGTFRNENPPGVKNGPLQINDFQQPKRNGRSVLERNSNEHP